MTGATKGRDVCSTRGHPRSPPTSRGRDPRLLAGSLEAPPGPAACGDDRTQAFAPALGDRSPSTSPAGHDAIPRYEIRVKGHLGPRWSAWFDGLTTTEDDRTTVITGPVVDQAALHGPVQKLRDVAIPLVSLRELPMDAPTEPNAHDTTERNLA